LRRLVECLGRDRTRHQVAEVTSLGLVQMTRKRISTGLLEAFSTNCEHCNGRGVVIRPEPVVPDDRSSSNGAKSRGESKSKPKRNDQPAPPVVGQSPVVELVETT
jgi:ribonuclease E